jgi:hypothetical protein
MTIGDHVEMFNDRSVRQFDAAAGLPNPADAAWRLALAWDDVDEGGSFDKLFGQFVETDGAQHVTTLIVGDWGHAGEGDGAEEVVRQLVMASARLKSLTALFLGEMTVEECEISWINQTDVSPLWQAFPQLQVLRLRGGTGLTLGKVEHANLRSLILETGGLPGSVLAAVGASQLPQLEHLELWLGDSGYGWDGSVEDLEPILSGRRFPKLRYLGLRDSEIADEVAAALAGSPILRQIEVLDLSMGTFSDVGAAALAADPAAKRLKVLDVSHHYMSDAGLAKLRGLGIMVRADEPQGDSPDDRYVAVGE